MSASALAQNSGLPPASIPGGDGRLFSAQGQDTASLLLRIDRLENQLRSQTGQMEQMQFQMRKLEEQVRKFQQDVDFRFQDMSGAKPTAKTTPAPQKRGDAFDPKTQPDAPGAPRSLGSLAAAAPALSGPLGAPNDEMSDEEEAAPSNGPIDLAPRPAAPARSATNANRDMGQAQSSAVQTMAALPAAKGPADDYANALSAYKADQYEEAELGLQAFIRKYPKDQLTPEAVFYLGESFTKRKRHREAAEQYLKVSTDYSKAARAPEAMVKLGFALEQLGLKEQACATFGEMGRKFPSASAALRSQADREFKRYQC
ncbi:MAG: tol-pal system protein YbgF [Alphaproteobacteria bacterium]|nr:tol-pal system protein YbgF [Alphaproteobacteria bacterium]